MTPRLDETAEVMMPNLSGLTIAVTHYPFGDLVEQA